MVVILGLFYFGQDQRLRDEAAVVRALDTTIAWVLGRGYRNVLLETDNECDNDYYDDEVLKPARVTEPILFNEDDRYDFEKLWNNFR